MKTPPTKLPPNRAINALVKKTLPIAGAPQALNFVLGGLDAARLKRALLKGAVTVALHAVIPKIALKNKKHAGPYSVAVQSPLGSVLFSKGLVQKTLATKIGPRIYRPKAYGYYSSTGYQPGKTLLSGLNLPKQLLEPEASPHQFKISQPISGDIEGEIVICQGPPEPRT